MKERPILFSGPMVRAILDGRKTQTRRVVKPQPHKAESVIFNQSEFEPDYGFYFKPNGGMVKCPYGKVGDRLWVRETTIPCWKCDYHNCVADNPTHCASCDENLSDLKKKPSIFMPKYASRITLEITDISVERLNDISTWDIQSEMDVRKLPVSEPKRPETDIETMFIHDCRKGFRELWESINGQGSWEANPWVWVVEFKKI
jgi:hypothetical protein